MGINQNVRLNMFMRPTAKKWTEEGRRTEEVHSLGLDRVRLDTRRAVEDQSLVACRH